MSKLQIHETSHTRIYESHNIQTFFTETKRFFNSHFITIRNFAKVVVSPVDPTLSEKTYFLPNLRTDVIL